jgi:hypothetical protein
MRGLAGLSTAGCSGSLDRLGFGAGNVEVRPADLLLFFVARQLYDVAARGLIVSDHGGLFAGLALGGLQQNNSAIGNTGWAGHFVHHLSIIDPDAGVGVLWFAGVRNSVHHLEEGSAA